MLNLLKIKLRILFAVLVLLSNLAHAKILEDAVSDISEKIWDAGFSELQDIKLMSTSLGSGRFEPRIGRDVFKSKDSVSIYRVVDRLYLPLKFPLYEYKKFSKSLAHVFGAKLDSEIGLEFVKIRGVHAELLDELPDPNEELKSVWDELDRSRLFEDTSVNNNFGFTIDSQQASQEIELPSQWVQKIPGLNIENPEVQARLDHFSELFTQSFRFPFSIDRLKKNMNNGDIVAYSFNGMASFGLNALSMWPLPFDLTDLKASVGVAAAVYGRYRIAVLKQSDRFVQVQVSYLSGPGVQASFGSQTSYQPVTGFFLTDYIGDPTHVVPFSIKVDRRNFKEVINTYRFDLSNPMAQEAYLKAVRGNFIAVEKLAKQENQGVVQSPLEVARHQQRSSERVNAAGIFYKVRVSSDRRIVELVDDQGRVNSRQAITEVKHEESIFKLLKEKEETRYYIKDDGVDSGKYRMLIWCRISDNNTKHKELNKYLDYVEKQVSKPGLLPRPVESKSRFLGRQALYSKIDLNFQMELNSSLLDDFLSLSETQRWSALESVFGVSPGEWGTAEVRKKYNQRQIPKRMLARLRDLIIPSKLSGRVLDVAQGIEKYWSNASMTNNPKERIAELSKLFSNQKTSRVVLELLHLVLDGKEVDYSIIGFNRFLGNMNYQGRAVIRSETNFIALQKENEDDVRLEYQDLKKTTDVLEVLSLSQSEVNPHDWQLDFKLDEIPTAWKFKFEFPRKTRIKNRLLPPKKINIEVSNPALELGSKILEKGHNTVHLPEKAFKKLKSELNSLSGLNNTLCFSVQVTLKNTFNLEESKYCVSVN